MWKLTLQKQTLSKFIISNFCFFNRSSIILRAAGLVATKYRYDTMARVMLGQGKTSIQADIDSVAELVDFLKFNVQYGKVRVIFIIKPLSACE